MPLPAHTAEHGYCLPARLPKILAWPGGKHKLVRALCLRIPPHRTYVEPFAGRASLFFGKRPSEVEVLADADCKLIEFYRTIRELRSLDEITKYGWAVTREAFERAKACVESDQCDLDDPTYRAYAFLYANKSGYGGKRGRMSYNPAKEATCSERELCGIKELYRRWDDVRKRLRQAVIECADFRDTIRKYDAPDTFFYCDPPYYEVAGEGHYSSDVDPRDVAKALRGIRGKFLLSYNDHPLIRELFRGYRIEEVGTAYEMGKAERGGALAPKTELLIMNYEAVIHE
jgi:DNA adenine methylase